MTNFPTRLPSHYSSTSSLVSTEDEDEVHSFSSSLAEDHKAALAPSGEQRVSLGKKIWRFLTFANWRNRSSLASTKGDVQQKPLTERKVEVGKEKVLQSRREKWTEKLMKFFCLSKPLSDRGVSTKVARVFRRKSPPEPDTLGKVLFKLQYREEDGDYQHRVNALFRSKDNQKDNQQRVVRYQICRDSLESLISLQAPYMDYPLSVQQHEQCDSAFARMDEAVGLPNFGDEIPPHETYRGEDS